MKSTNSAITFPTVTVCLHSQHSLQRMQTNYSQIDLEILRKWWSIFYLFSIAKWYDFVFSRSMESKFYQEASNFDDPFQSRFYGSQDRLNLTDQQWLELNKIDIEHFLYVTRPKYKMLMCDLQGHDCKHRWMFKRTYFGYCLQQNASWFFRIHPNTTSNTRFRWMTRNLIQTHTVFILILILNLWSFTFLWNASDSTFGWNGNVTGMSVFYTHYASKLVDMGEDLKYRKGVP